VAKDPTAGGFENQVVTTKLASLVNWCRKYSLFQYPFATACCGMEYMAVAGSHYDVDRFGAAVPRFSPRQADVLWVVGTITHKNAPVLRRIYEQMTEPKWVIAFGVCASTGGFYDNYATVPGIDHIIPVDVYIPGCPPRPEAVLDAILMLQDQIQHEPLRVADESDQVPEEYRIGSPSDAGGKSEAGW
jgi:NADH-quinone oxidoreductase subunit B